ncbi:zinc-binding alcohol dehydrogenase family protein [Ideonella sp. DXS29W]|uniref:Zinc-type alcohol dehydrogenase-like protein n=1 Tax=Ideonella lacteola TaxID=2984193 RepID=A0ABU9BT39_9BURK
MKAIAQRRPLPLNVPDSLELVELPEPTPGPHDLLVQVQAVSVNPVDVKVRAGMPVPEGQVRVLGWDAAGTVLAVGSEVRGFEAGDRVWYAGAIDRQGSNAERQVVDARIVSHMPRTLDFAQAAALPLTAITAWELLFDRLGVAPGGGEGQRLLVVGAAGGVGSILVQLARRFTQLEVIGTASRLDTQAWVKEMGAHHVVDHSGPLDQALASAGLGPVHLVASLTQTTQHYTALVNALAPQGKLALIDDSNEPIDVRPLKAKSLSLHWEMMFTRSRFQTADMARQGELLAEVAKAVDAGTLRTTMTRHFGKLGVATLVEAHAHVESGRAIGKVVLDGL